MGLPPGETKKVPSLSVAKPLTVLKGSTSSHVQVAVRIRPLNNQENVDVVSKHTAAPVVVVDSRDSKVFQKQFEYDYVFDEDSDHDSLFECVSPLIQSCLCGYNATVFAYGQTGSGKTFTMGSDGTNPHGIIPKAAQELFDCTAAFKQANDQYHVQYHVRFVEVYGEEVRDLLSPTLKKLVRVSDKVSQEPVESVKECLLLLEKGMLSRKTGKTKMNAVSSRSHAIFTLMVEQRLPGTSSTRQAWLNFVDLAGSERQKKTLAEGLRFKEGVDINKGLLALGNVIHALSEGKSHIPYRDSKLTKLLQDSLGGNSHTLMLACISPARRNMSETLNTLEYASRARKICNKLVLNEKQDSLPPLMATEVAKLRHEVLLLTQERDLLQKRVAQLERCLSKDATPCCVGAMTLASDESVETAKIETETSPEQHDLGAIHRTSTTLTVMTPRQCLLHLMEQVGLIYCCMIVCALQICCGETI